jgi:hypothetical protein
MEAQLPQSDEQWDIGRRKVSGDKTKRCEMSWHDGRQDVKRHGTMREGSSETAWLDGRKGALKQHGSMGERKL